MRPTSRNSKPGCRGRSHFIESGLMTPAFAQLSHAGRGLAVYGDAEASLEINGTDHLRLLGFRPGEQLPMLWSLLNRLDDRIENFAHQQVKNKILNKNKP